MVHVGFESGGLVFFGLFAASRCPAEAVAVAPFPVFYRLCCMVVDATIVFCF